MKELFETLAEYNRRTNQEVMTILQDLEPEQLSRRIGGFFGSIIGTANHVLLSDIGWLRRFAHGCSVLSELRDTIPDVKADHLTDTPWIDLNSLRPVREEVDALLQRTVHTIAQHDLSLQLRYVDSRGQHHEKTLWIALLHVFNHQTHHRGQIALMLDELGIDNDYSNLVWKF